MTPRAVSAGDDPVVNAATIWTIGHSVRPAADLAALLEAHRIELLADVRRTPFSRRHPQFSRDALARTLGNAGIEYVHLPGLGGMREPTESDLNAGLRVAWMRAYADYMQTPEFVAALEGLIGRASSRRTAMMCAEGDPRRCHRSLVADALIVRGIDVLHIVDAGPPPAHQVHPHARPHGFTVAYPPTQTTIGPG